MDYKICFGSLAIIIGFLGYIPYFKELFSGKIKPHAFSWLIWSILPAITFAAQATRGAGPGAWVSGFWFLSCFVIFLFSMKRGEKNIVFLDWLSLFAAGVSILFWYLTSSPLLTVIIITCIDCIAFIPTIRKSYAKPYEENATLYICSSISYVFSIMAMEHYSVITTFNPAVLVPINFLFACMLFWRRNV
jgi:hypothetical protein